MGADQHQPWRSTAVARTGSGGGHFAQERVRLRWTASAGWAAATRMTVAGALKFASEQHQAALTRIRAVKMAVALVLASSAGAPIAVKLTGALLNQVSTFVMDEIGAHQKNDVRESICRFVSDKISIPVQKHGQFNIGGIDATRYSKQESHELLTWPHLTLQSNGFAF